jgi:hypothetical protein
MASTRRLYSCSGTEVPCCHYDRKRTEEQPVQLRMPLSLAQQRPEPAEYWGLEMKFISRGHYWASNFIPMMTTLGELRSTAAEVVWYIERITPAFRTSSGKPWKQLEERVLGPILEPTTSWTQGRGVTTSANFLGGAYQTYEYSLYYIDNKQSQTGKIYKRKFI